MEQLVLHLSDTLMTTWKKKILSGVQVAAIYGTADSAVKGENSSWTMFFSFSWDSMLLDARKHRNVRLIYQGVDNSSTGNVEMVNEPCLQERRQI
jgi:hypothetical protein